MCALDHAARAFCWGANQWGQLGSRDSRDQCRTEFDGRVPCSTTPVAVAGNGRWQAIETGYEHACAIAMDGAVYCWGRNAHGEIGLPPDAEQGCRDQPNGYCSPVPSRLPGDNVFVRISIGAWFSCGITDAGTALCWGWNSTPQGHVPSGPKPGVRFREISRARCGLAEDGSVYCWNRDARDSTVKLEAPVAFQSLTVGWEHSCALDLQQQAWCWGDNDAGQLGLGTVEPLHVTSPVRATFDLRFVSLTLPLSATCGLTGRGELHCWGYNARRQLLASTTDKCMFVDAYGPCNLRPQLATSPAFTHVTSYPFSHICGVTADGSVFCWGDNSAGQFGNGTKKGSRTPVQVMTALHGR
jgi:alpha-tubulin suppressor-like RCC1 family protein